MQRHCPALTFDLSFGHRRTHPGSEGKSGVKALFTHAPAASTGPQVGIEETPNLCPWHPQGPWHPELARSSEALTAPGPGGPAGWAETPWLTSHYGTQMPLEGPWLLPPAPWGSPGTQGSFGNVREARAALTVVGPGGFAQPGGEGTPSPTPLGQGGDTVVCAVAPLSLAAAPRLFAIADGTSGVGVVGLAPGDAAAGGVGGRRGWVRRARGAQPIAILAVSSWKPSGWHEWREGIQTPGSNPTDPSPS